MNLDDVDREAAKLAQDDAVLNQAWLWHLPQNRVEAFVLGPALIGYGVTLAGAVSVPVWPWWLRLGAATVLVGPWLLVASGMAVRSWWTGAGPLAALTTVWPLLAWLALVVLLHTQPLPVWAQWCYLVGYLAATAGTVSWWHQWTEKTRAVRRRIRWLRDDTTQR
ncbi:hypothetical protein [Saccharopolyspora spinosa]|uniref:Uncharacterized protein n=1 Tax=Saccharopolyspora spinosa TaxID=60894 RepID=A0A2N3XSS5_SACSN|nr:hypothetical protein [Saccharopolyspora spinosa]PKW13671.1 hypothetical protein A8926_1219 [Saccharopolyspora spinosa]